VVQQNPWVSLSQSNEFVLSCDEPFVRAHNHALLRGLETLSETGRATRRRHLIDLNLPPVPFQGLFDAPVVILLANPGHHDDDEIDYLSPEVSDLLMASATSERGAPFAALTPEFRGSKAKPWWEARTAQLAGDLGGGDIGYEILANNLLAVELHGYHSKDWSAPVRNFPSQEFGFSLVEDAIQRGALILVARCQRHWYGSVPSLGEYDRCIEGTSSTRSAYFSRRNLGDQHYEQLLEALRRGRSTTL
jgi:hypothetical protein